MNELAKGKISNINVTFGFVAAQTVDYIIQAFDTGSGTISAEEFHKRIFNISGKLLDEVLEARGNKLDLIEFLSSKTEVLNWLEDIRPILIENDGKGQIMVEFKYPDKLPEATPGLNTLNIKQLEEAFARVVSLNNGQVYDGIFNGHINLEDSLPCFEIYFEEKSSLKKAKEFCQQLSDEMNIRILFNRIQGNTKEFTVYGVMDIDYEEVAKGCDIVPALSRDGEWAEFMEDYGTEIFPSHTKKKKSKLKP